MLVTVTGMPPLCREPTRNATTRGPRQLVVSLRGERSGSSGGTVAGVLGGTGGGCCPRAAGGGEGQGDLHGGAGAWRALQRDAAVDSLDPVFDPDKAGAATEGCTSAPVVADPNVQNAVTGGHLDIGGGGVRVLDGVGQRLGDGAVGGDL